MHIRTKIAYTYTFTTLRHWHVRTHVNTQSHARTHTPRCVHILLPFSQMKGYMFPSSGAPTQMPPAPSSVNTSSASGSSSRQFSYVVIASAPSSHVQLLRQSRHAADGGEELLPAVQPPQSSPVLRRPIHTGVFPLWRRSHHTVSNASNYIKSFLQQCALCSQDFAVYHR